MWHDLFLLKFDKENWNPHLYIDLHCRDGGQKTPFCKKKKKVLNDQNVNQEVIEVEVYWYC